MEQYILALDAGTTSNRCILFDSKGQMRGVTQREFTQIYPKPGWVEHDPMEIWATQSAVLAEALAKAGGAGVHRLSGLRSGGGDGERHRPAAHRPQRRWRRQP